MKQQTGHKKEEEKTDAKVTANMLMIALYQVKKPQTKTKTGESERKKKEKKEVYYDLLIA